MKTNKFKSDAVYADDESGIVNPKDYKGDKDTGHTPMKNGYSEGHREDATLGKAQAPVAPRKKLEENPAGFSGHKEDRDYSYNNPGLHPEPDEKSDMRPTQNGHGTVNRSLSKVKPLADDEA